MLSPLEVHQDLTGTQAWTLEPFYVIHETISETNFNTKYHMCKKVGINLTMSLISQFEVEEIGPL